MALLNYIILQHNNILTKLKLIFKMNLEEEFFIKIINQLFNPKMDL